MSSTAKTGLGAKPLKFLNLDSPYRRYARFFPALLTVAVLLPVAVMLGVPLGNWLVALSAGAGIAAVAGAAVVALSHLAAAAGNRMQAKLFPRWPHDAPTNRRLQEQRIGVAFRLIAPPGGNLCVHDCPGGDGRPPLLALLADPVVRLGRANPRRHGRCV